MNLFAPILTEDVTSHTGRRYVPFSALLIGKIKYTPLYNSTNIKKRATKGYVGTGNLLFEEAHL